MYTFESVPLQSLLILSIGFMYIIFSRIAPPQITPPRITPLFRTPLKNNSWGVIQENTVDSLTHYHTGLPLPVKSLVYSPRPYIARI